MRHGWAAEEGCGDGCCGPIGDLDLFGNGLVTVGTSGGVTVGGSVGGVGGSITLGGGSTPTPTPTPTPAPVGNVAGFLIDAARTVSTVTQVPLASYRPAALLRSVTIAGGPSRVIQTLPTPAPVAPVSKKKIAIVAGAGVAGAIALWGLFR